MNPDSLFPGKAKHGIEVKLIKLSSYPVFVELIKNHLTSLWGGFFNYNLQFFAQVLQQIGLLVSGFSLQIISRG